MPSNRPPSVERVFAYPKRARRTDIPDRKMRTCKTGTAALSRRWSQGFGDSFERIGPGNVARCSKQAEISHLIVPSRKISDDLYWAPKNILEIARIGIQAPSIEKEKVLGKQTRGMTMSSLVWVCLGLWVAINCFILVRLVLRPTRSEKVEPMASGVVGQSAGPRGSGSGGFVRAAAKH